MKRDDVYKGAGLCPTMIFVTSGPVSFCVDGYMDDQGEWFERKGNPANLFNHNATNPNCVLEPEGEGWGMQLYLRTRRRVAAGFELTWNYGDHRRGLEAFMYGK